MTLGKGSSVTLGRPSSSDASFTGVVKLDAFTLAGEVSIRIEGEVFELQGLIDSSKE